jgi:hypothetical protein
MNQSPSLQAPPAPRRIGRWLTIVVIVGLTTVLAWRGHGFYQKGLADRVMHPEFRTLRPSGLIGHGYGIVGTAMILTNLLYLVRRRLAKRIPAWMGSVKAWLNAHVFTGLVGSVLILFHSAFQLRTPIATVTSASLAIVVCTGLVGLYLYALVPKEGLKPLNDRLAEIEPLLPGLAEQVRAFVRETPLTAVPADASFVRTVLTVPRWAYQAGKRRRGIRNAARRDKMVRVLEHNDRKLARAFYVELGELAASEVDAHAGAALMRTWRSLHRFLAILMIVSVSVHIGVAWFYGFRWIFE